MQIVEIGNKISCSTCGLVYHELPEFGGLILCDLVCDCGNEMSTGKFHSFTHRKNLMPIDDKETKEAFEKLNEMNRIENRLYRSRIKKVKI